MQRESHNNLSIQGYGPLCSSYRLARLRHLIIRRSYTHGSRLDYLCVGIILTIANPSDLCPVLSKEIYDDAAETSSSSTSTTGSEDVCSSAVATGLSVSPFDSRSADEVLRCECGASGLSRMGEVLLAIIPLVEVARAGWPACAGGEAWGILHRE